MPNLIYLIVGSIFAVLLLGTVVLASLATVNLSPVPYDLFATTTPSYRIALYLAYTFCTINEYLIANAIPGIGRWWEALFNWFVVTGLFATVAYRLPFQLKQGNEWRAGLLGSAWWVVACSFVVANMPPNPSLTNRVIDYVTLFGIIPFFFLGYYIVQQRYLVYSSVATALIEEIEENFDSNELYRAKYGSRNDDVIVGAFRNPYVYLPPTVRQFGAGPAGLEILGRLMWHSSSARSNVEASYRLYRKAEQAFPDLAYVKFLRANCLTFIASDTNAFAEQIDGVKRLEPNFFVRFLLYKRDAESKIRGSQAKKDGQEQSLDLVAYVDFQKHYA
jgi:hypothetical protein